MPREKQLGDYILYYDSHTPLDAHESGDRICAIFGYAADLESGRNEGLAEYILDSSLSLEDVIEAERKLGGKYLVFYKDAGDCFVFGDATCSIPIYYTPSQMTLFVQAIQCLSLEKTAFLPTKSCIISEKVATFLRQCPSI